MSAPREYSEQADRIVARDPAVEVSRYRGFTRINHWVTAAALVLLLISGMALFHPALYFLSGLFGGGQTTRWLHPFIGIFLAASFLIMFVQLWSLNLIRREDVVWAKNIDAVVTGREEDLPELGKYNLGQKFVFWGMFWLILVLLLTGIAIWYRYFPDLVTVEQRRIALVIHAVSAVLITLVVILHIYAAIWTRGTIRAMTRGTVTGGWAWRHHRKWLREIARREGQRPAE